MFLTETQLKASFDGFRLVLIGDLHEQPMLHLKIKSFIIGAQDWSGQVPTSTFRIEHDSHRLTPVTCINDYDNHNCILEFDQFSLGTSFVVLHIINVSYSRVLLSDRSMDLYN